MAGAKIISTWLTICAACGHEARVVASTSEEVISRCYACGDLKRTHPVPPVWGAEAALQGRRQGPVEAVPGGEAHRQPEGGVPVAGSLGGASSARALGEVSAGDI